MSTSTISRVQPRCRLRLALGCCIAALLGAPAVSAHGGLPSGTAPFVEGGELVGAATSYGFLHVDGDRGEWTAEEAAEDDTLWIHYAGDSRLLAGTFRGVIETTDWGCSWTPLEGSLGTTKIGQIVADPDDPQHLLAFTDVTNQPVRTFESVDGGTQWDATSLSELDGNFLSAAVSPEASALWVLVAPESGVELWRSEGVDGDWELVPFDWEEGTHLELRGTSDDGDGVYLSDSVPNAASESDLNDARLLFLDVSDESSVEPDVLGSFEALEISAFVRFDGGSYVTVDSADTYRLGGSPDEAEVLEAAPPLCDTQPEEGVLWGCGILGYDDQLSSSTDLMAWEPRLGFGAVCPAQCADDTAGAMLNDALWPEVYLAGVGGDECVPEQFRAADAGASAGEGSDAPGGKTSSAGCGVVNLAPSRSVRGVLWLTLAGLLVWRWRRRRGVRTRQRRAATGSR